jgi:hypothetical protein
VITNRRTLTYVAISLIVGAALALAVALARSDAPAAGSGPAAAQTQAQGGVLGDTSGAGTIASADPAKQEPLLDKFTAKDPFALEPPPPPQEPSASVRVNGTTYTVKQDDTVPGSSPAFTISSITSGDVTFTVIDGALKNGDPSITVNLGETVSVTLENGKTYELSVLSIPADGGPIKVLSISSSNGVAVVTFEVGGVTYADKQVGDVFMTSAGEIKVIAINVDAQTVTYVLGDQTITQGVGQVVVK